MITPQELENLAELARIEVSKAEEKKILEDLEKILAHFEELKELDTTTVAPMAGGTSLENVFQGEEHPRVASEKAVQALPKPAQGFLKVPPVFE